MLKQHVLVELKQFINAVSYRNNQKKLTNPSLIRTSLMLLVDLPAAREIVFEYFTLVAEITVQSYTISANANIDPQTGLPLPQQQQQMKNGSNQGAVEDTSFLAIQETLENLINKGPTAWGPVIAAWSMDLVGRLSDKYTKRKMPIGAACNYWLNCSTMHGLLKLISVCFRKLTNTEAETCVEALLGAFQRYSMSFDWILARLGGCFPLKIIAQILQCGLKRFADDYRCRFDSEIGILDYLSFVHEHEIKIALKEMLHEGFQPKKSLDASVIPFLIVLSNYSDLLLQNLVTVFLEMYNDELLGTIVQKAPLWMSNKLFAEMQPSLQNVALRLNSHGATVLIAVAKMADKFSWCQDFLEFSLQELEQIVLNARICPLMDDLATEDTKYMLWKSSLSANIYEQQTAVRLLLIVSTQHSHIYYQTISELLRKCYTANPSGIGAVIRIIGGQSGVVEFPEIKPGLQMVLEDVLLQEQFQRSRLTLASDTYEALNTFKNLNTLTKLQKKNSFPFMRPHLLVHVLNDCLPKILHILEVTLTKLLLHMDAEAAERSAQKTQVLQSNNNISSALNVHSAEKKVKTDPVQSAEQSTTDEEMPSISEISSADEKEEDKHPKRLLLAHTIIDLLNTIEAGSKLNVMRTTEVCFIGISHSKSLLGEENETAIQVLTAWPALMHKRRKYLGGYNLTDEELRLSRMGFILRLRKLNLEKYSESVLKLSVLSVKYFFLSLNEKSAVSRSAAVNRAFLLFERQCSARKAARTACMRELIEGALFYYGYLFGQYDEPEMDELGIPDHEMVLFQNQRHSVGPSSNRSVLHAGVIGRGLRPEHLLTSEDDSCSSEMQMLLLKALDSCCADADKLNVSEGHSTISLLLVELVSTDIMYNGLPFPDEEFTKVTMERDLLIRRAFVTSPILWALLGFVAANRPALCFSSVLLRALCATCLHQWRAKNVSKFQPYNPSEELMKCTQKLLKILAMGQLIPPPLSNLHVIIQYFEAPEIALILKECIWNYLKDHVPSPALFHVDSNCLHWRNSSMSKIPSQYVDTLRNLMQKKLTKLGQHYHQMFIMSELNASASGTADANSDNIKIVETEK